MSTATNNTPGALPVALDGLVLDGVMHIEESRQQAPDEVLKNTLANFALEHFAIPPRASRTMNPLAGKKQAAVAPRPRSRRGSLLNRKGGTVLPFRAQRSLGFGNAGRTGTCRGRAIGTKLRRRTDSNCARFAPVLLGMLERC
jgi:hypothetical protein